MKNRAFNEELELASAALLRGVETAWTWDEIEIQARALALECGAQPFETRADCTNLLAAARALEGVAQGAPGGGALARERGVWASAAFAANANFPAASVTLRRTFPRLRAPDAATATLMCAIAPALRDGLRAQTPLAAALDDFFAGEIETARVWKIWDSIKNEIWAPELWSLARAGLDAALESSTVRALDEIRFPDGFVARLGAQLPTFLPPQLRAVRDGYLSGGNVLAALPPGTGKTLLGELFLAATLGNGPGLTVFLVPYVSLGRGVAASLRAHFPDEIPVHRWIGGWGGEEKSRAHERAEIAVMTPERFDAMLRARPEVWGQLRGVVVDEAHTLSAGARGVRLEGLIARLRARQNAGHKLFLMLLSAALDERENLENWADISHRIESSWTPTARRLAFWRQGHLEWHAEIASGATRALGASPAPWPHRVAHAQGWARVRQNEPLTWKNVAHLAHEFHEKRGGAILCLCATRRATREVARALGAHFPPETALSGAAARAVAAIEERHRTLLPLARLIERGVVWHNSSLPPEVRDAVESAIETGQIHAVAATSTLAEGVDLPFAQTIVVDWLHWDEGAQTPLSSGLFRNIAGRCGRAGSFTEGDTLVFDNPLGPAQWTAPDARAEVQRRQFVGAFLSEPRSALEAETLEGHALGAALESQLLALRIEAPRFTIEETANLFYVARKSDDFAGRVARIWDEFEARGLTENGILSARGAAFGHTDWSPASCERLLGALQALPAQTFDDAAGAARLNAYLWRALGALPEAGGEVERFFRTRSRLVARPENLETIGRAWLRGQTPEAMFGELPRAQGLPGLATWLERDELPAGVAPEVPQWNGEFDRWLDWLRAGMENWTPHLWRAAAMLAPLAGPRAQSIGWRKWAARFESGADSDWAVSALRSGAPGGRASCALVGRHWPLELRGEDDARIALDAATGEAGGAYCFAGRNVMALRDWIWARAGWTK